jgi:hypothetical protein
VILFSIKFNNPSGENILAGIKVPLISGQVGAAWLLYGPPLMHQMLIEKPTLQL